MAVGSPIIISKEEPSVWISLSIASEAPSVQFIPNNRVINTFFTVISLVLYVRHSDDTARAQPGSSPPCIIGEALRRCRHHLVDKDAICRTGLRWRGSGERWQSSSLSTIVNIIAAGSSSSSSCFFERKKFVCRYDKLAIRRQRLRGPMAVNGNSAIHKGELGSEARVKSLSS